MLVYLFAWESGCFEEEEFFLSKCNSKPVPSSPCPSRNTVYATAAPPNRIFPLGIIILPLKLETVNSSKALHFRKVLTWVVRLWTGFMWLDIGNSGMLLAPR
jgi:hypothetical protein